jgi:hypothetical protein
MKKRMSQKGEEEDKGKRRGEDVIGVLYMIQCLHGS